MSDLPEISMSASSTRESSVSPEGLDLGESQGPELLDVPPEVIVQVFHLLSMTDRLSLRRVSKTLHEIYNESSTLQYDLTLLTSAYLDIPFEHPPEVYYDPALLPITVAPSEKDEERGRGRTSTRFPDTSSSSHPPHSVVFPLPFDPPLSERVHRPSTRPLGAAEKNTLLVNREKQWSWLNPVCERQFEIKGPAGVYELQEGIFLMCDEYSDTDDGKPSTIRLLPLPSSEDPDLDNPSIPLKSAKLPFSIADLTMDPTQDLIIVSEHRPISADNSSPVPTHRYHILTLSTFAPHPCAASPTLDFPPYLHPIMSSRQLLQVMGDVLVILVSRYMQPWLVAGLGMGMPFANNGNEEEVVCWNWKTGKVLARSALPENGWFASFALLTPTTFMVTSTSNVSQVISSDSRATAASIFPPVIQIFSFGPDPENDINPVQPLVAEFHDDTTPRPVLLTQLELPRFAPGATISTFDVRPDPAFPPRIPGESAGPRIGSSKPFTQDPGKGVLVFDLQIAEPAEGPEGGDLHDTASYELFVLRETMVDMAREGEERLRIARLEGGADGYERSKIEESIRWEDWGRDKARMMNASMERRNWVYSCSGYRFVSLIPSEDLPTFATLLDEQNQDPPRRSDLRLFDFNPYAVRREINRSKPHSVPWDGLQDVPTSSAPAPLQNEDIKALLREMKQWDDSLDGDDYPQNPGRLEQERERIFERFRRQYDKMFYAASDRADRSRSDRADRERGRGRAGGTRSDSASQSRSRSRSQHHLSGRHHHTPRGTNHSHSRTRQHYSPSPGPSLMAGSSSLRERRSRSRTPRSVSPSAIFRRASQPINMAGPDMEILDVSGPDDAIMEDGEDEEDDDEDWEVRLVTAPTVLERRKVWKEDVVSGLQFKEIWRRKEVRANGVMMDDQRIIVVCTDGKRNGDWSKIQQTMTVLCM